MPKKIEKQNKDVAIIAIDGGGTKTIGVLAGKNGRILGREKVGASNPNKVGFDESVNRLRRVILNLRKKALKNKAREVRGVYIALAGGLQRNQKLRKRIKNKLFKGGELNFISRKNLIIEGDELAAFRAGVNSGDGVLLIAGTGSYCCGWHKGKKSQTLGWDWLLGDEGSGFWLGQRALWAVCRDLDKRGPKTLLTDLIFQKLKIKESDELIKKIYSSNIIEKVADISKLLDKAARKGDREAEKILLAGANELAKAAIRVISETRIKDEKFPFVLAGGVFKSKIVRKEFERKIKKIAPKVIFIEPKVEPIIGALKVAMEKFYV